MSVQNYVNAAGQLLSINASGSTILTATAGNDDLIARAANTSFVGDANADTFVGAGGGDVYSVDNSNTVIIQAAGSSPSTVHALASYVLPENVQNLIAYGTGWAPITYEGNSGNNLMIATAVNQSLNGMGGDDVLVGSAAGQDYFVFQANSGATVVDNFIGGTAANHDTIRIQDYGLYTFADVQAAMTQVGANVVLQLDANDSVTIQQHHPGRLHPRRLPIARRSGRRQPDLQHQLLLPQPSDQ